MIIESVETNAGGSVVESQNTPNASEGVSREAAGDGLQAPAEEQQAVAAPAEAQSREENARYAAARREAEAEANQLRERLRAAEETNQRALRAMQGYGFTGVNIGAALDEMEAQNLNITVEELHRQQAAQEQRIKEAVKNDPEYQKAMELQAEYRRRESERIFAEDLAAVKKAFPACKAQSVQDLGERFARLRANGLSATEAYEVMQMEERRTAKPSVAGVGPVGSGAGTESEYFTEEELANLEKTGKGLDDPKILEKAIRSMARKG